MSSGRPSDDASTDAGVYTMPYACSLDIVADAVGKIRPEAFSEAIFVGCRETGACLFHWAAYVFGTV